MGDFSSPHINWDLQTTIKTDNAHESRFIQTVQDCFLYQNIDQPTRARGTDAPSLIDLIFTNEEDMISDIQYLAPLGASDHVLVSFKYHCYTELGSTKKTYQYSQGDYNTMREALSESEWTSNFEKITQDLNIEDTWNLIKRKVLELQEEFVPTAIVSRRPNWNNNFPISEKF